ncbi:DUF4190 domain-containing protein [Streptomyces sp. QH1-20]|uniref:DUF4190 domain-containing protein n=1 Tax=Streptomyces sp. QH1-20 TaxID=3240934 RepID=UPI003513AEFC
MTQRAMFPPHQSPPATPNDRDGAGTAALVLALASYMLTTVNGGFFLVIPVGIAAIVCGVVGLRRAKRGEASNACMARVGLVLGSVITVPTACFLMWLLAGLYGAYA